MESYERAARLEEFTSQYAVAWNGSERPSYGETMEIFAAAISHEQPTDARQMSLWNFFRWKLSDKDIPLNWFSEHGPFVKRAAKLDINLIRGAGDIPDLSELIKSLLPTDLDPDEQK